MSDVKHNATEILKRWVLMCGSATIRRRKPSWKRSGRLNGPMLSPLRRIGGGLRENAICRSNSDVCRRTLVLSWYPVQDEAILNRCVVEGTYEYRLKLGTLPD